MLRRCLGGAVVCLLGSNGAWAADKPSVVVPTASAYFLSAPVSLDDASPPPAPEPVRLGALERTDHCQLSSIRNPLCELRWTTGRNRGKDVRARYYEMTDDVKARIVGNSRAEYFDLDLDTSPEFSFRLRF